MFSRAGPGLNQAQCGNFIRSSSPPVVNQWSTNDALNAEKKKLLPVAVSLAADGDENKLVLTRTHLAPGKMRMMLTSCHGSGESH